jgi:putative ATPase
MNLAYRLRPQTLEEYFGQDHLVGEGKLLQKMIETGNLSSMIFWGPPGSGKTTLAYIIAQSANADFHHLSAVETGKADLMKIIQEAQGKGESKGTILFVDEIHRWNKAQQDALLPYVESGLITLIGATTENPSFEIISALLSRCRVFVLKSLSEKDLEKIIDRALTDKKKGMGEYKKKIDNEAKELLIRLSGGDARIMLNALEIAVTISPQSPLSPKLSQKNIITPDIIKEIFQTKSAGLYDKKADEHYNIISAFIKSMRGSHVDASLYYLMRMLENGEDPKFIARRMIIFASEDIGMADRGALIQANEAFEAVNKIGMPEAQLILAHITIYLASAKKSRAVPNALGRAKQAVYEFPNEPIPLHLRNAPTKLMKDLDYGKGYKWPARNASSIADAGGSEEKVGPTPDLSFLPDKLKNKKFYQS